MASVVLMGNVSSVSANDPKNAAQWLYDHSADFRKTFDNAKKAAEEKKKKDEEHFKEQSKIYAEQKKLFKEPKKSEQIHSQSSHQTRYDQEDESGMSDEAEAQPQDD